MSKMVERVQKAIESLTQHHTGSSSEALARAAMAAMREPTEAMVNAGGEIENSNRVAVEIWQSMIDEALK